MLLIAHHEVMCKICHMSSGGEWLASVAMIGLWWLGANMRVRLARRFGVAHVWRAYLPLTQMDIDLSLGGVPRTWWILMPLWGLPLTRAWDNTLTRLGRSTAFSFLMWFPIVGALPLAYVVFTQPDYDAVKVEA